MKRFSCPALLFVIAVAFVACGSGGQGSPTAARSALIPAEFAQFKLPAVQPPALLAFRLYDNTLESWPIAAHGGKTPAKIRNFGFSANAVAADGNTLIVASANPPEIVFYDVTTNSKSEIPDPYGTPTDVALDKSANVYVTNLQAPNPPNVAMYPVGSTQPVELTCSLMTLAEGLVLDNEGDIYIVGNGAHGASGLFEIPNGPTGPQPQNCTRIDLATTNSGASGLAIDPATDDLIVMTDPDECAGGEEGRITIYPKPYSNTNHTGVVLGGNCPGGIWLNATSSEIFYSDSDVSGSFTFIRQSSYPAGKSMGTYSNGHNPGPFATIPNTLPN